MHPSAPPDLPRLRGRALLASIAVFIALIGPACLALATLTFGASRNSTEGQVGRALLGGGVVYMMLTWPIAGIVVMLWLRRARSNAEALNPDFRHRCARGWVIAGWIVPIANLFVPPLMVADVLRASSAVGTGSRAVVAWWTTWLTAHLTLVVGFVALNNVEYPRGASALGQFLLLTLALFAVAAFTLRSIMVTVARSQDGR
ncbi:DUF4328 domain-containing protein [Nocardia otitidiscaviarum]|uniref:DUF4328 domain-containing protein n=1 Tax=Nocardia otitidiscaviarum TaxID=1823 RepID=UPI0009DCB698|nr:DUF4328 domain-containing protein [Nocardia otitidiscaviarum]MBF6488296.1 DUF4328 domain-containing protein [Nocardia otitidiscaviarum]